jgi:nuclear pore complex protein Nup155
LTITTAHPGQFTSARENREDYRKLGLQEFVTTEYIPSQVWAVVEVPSTSITSPSALLASGMSDSIAMNPLARQFLGESRQFLVLASSGLFWVVQPRPVDLLEADLEVEKEVAGKSACAT